MSQAVQWIIVAVLVLAAVVFLIQRLRPSKKDCCSGCPYAGACHSAGKDLTTCPTPPSASSNKKL